MNSVLIHKHKTQVHASLLQWFFISLILVLIFGCNATDRKETMGKAEVTYLALGDSYTIGEGVAENERYPLLLADSLDKTGFSLSRVQVIARTGWTTDELNAAMNEADLDASYDLVTLLIGVNNQYRGRTPQDYQPEFAALLQRAVSLANGDPKRVVVLSIPDWGVTPFAQNRNRDQIASEIDAYNQINRQISIDAGVQWLDVTAVSRLAASQPDLLAPDGLHPSGKMYRQWMDDLFPLAMKALSQ
jgi:lysophospholipase L1-like esterase